MSFSPSGNRLAMVSHGSIVSVVTGGSDLVSLRTEYLPFNDCLWVTENSFVAAVIIKVVCGSVLYMHNISFFKQGHDCNPMLFSVDGNCTKIEFQGKLDQPPKGGGGGKAVSAMNMFRMMDKKGAVETSGKDVETKHKNAITQVRK